MGPIGLISCIYETENVGWNGHKKADQLIRFFNVYG